MRIALRVEVCSLRGLREGIPNLLRLFGQYRVRASFFFPLGRDLSGRQPRATWRARHRLGLAALAYGTLVIGPSLTRSAAVQMAAVRADGHEVGLLGLSPQYWLRHLAHADSARVERECADLWARHLELGGRRPSALATPGWQVHPALLAGLSAARYRYSSLTRGRLPYYPVLLGVRSAIPEIPTTLPAAAEVLQQRGVTQDKLHEFLYAESRHLLPAGHVYSASAEREGLDMLPLMERLLVMWRGQEALLRPLGTMLDELDATGLPCHQVGWGEVPGGRGPMAMQSVRLPG